MMKDIQENMNNLYDGPFNSGSMMGRTQGGGNIQQGMHTFLATVKSRWKWILFWCT